MPVHGRPLAVTEPVMRHGTVPGVDKPVSRLVMGCDNQPDIRHAAVMFDHYFERGGNTFDTAHIYGGGRMESLLGAWIANRGVRDDVVIIGKGAHTPANHPDRVAPQLDVSLERLGTDHVDLYFLHRDNPDVGVGEWIDALNRECDAGRMRAFGASNWSLARVREANAYARANGLRPFAAVSNQFSLARMVDAVWPGCVSASTPEWRTWLAAEGLALFPWSSQARGFFTPRFDAVRAKVSSGVDPRRGNQPSDDEMRRCWFAEDNFARRERAVAMAGRTRRLSHRRRARLGAVPAVPVLPAHRTARARGDGRVPLGAGPRTHARRTARTPRSLKGSPRARRGWPLSDPEFPRLVLEEPDDRVFGLPARRNTRLERVAHDDQPIDPKVLVALRRVGVDRPRAG